MYTEVFFDIETQKLFSEVSAFNPSLLGVSIVSVYVRQINADYQEQSGQMSSFWENELGQMWPLFANANRVIGFNSLGFDVPILAPLCPFNFKKLNHFDLMDKVKQVIGFRVSLNTLAKSTLGLQKSDEGINAVLYWQKHDPLSLQKLKQYCEDDVYLTRDLYDYGLHHHQFKFIDKWNSPRVVNIDFSYPPADDSQIQLF
ncbi:MAG: ribonuclease H-like domain-containing protein [Candidatus Shapirobacteria bacterium]